MKNIYIATLLVLFFCATSILANDWGEIRYTHSAVNVRASRSAKSEIVAKLKIGQKMYLMFKQKMN